MLKPHYYENPNIIEIGVDEVGRGPLFGRVYTASVILPKDNSFDHSKMKDSKKFHSKTKIKNASDYIKENAISWSVNFENEKVIDDVNILQSTQRAMHKSILETRNKYLTTKLLSDEEEIRDYKLTILVDGNYFNQVTVLNKNNTKLICIDHMCIKGGDNIYSSIAAASILAKVERDAYIEELCEEHPELNERYDIKSNKGYGTKKHLDGIKQYGLSPWHRKTFGICKLYA